ncbi:MAG: hypothetical protein DWQ34_08325 [Planctomycetota bacterium]|nr:MAG: hypothetical protein DWQ34_08325 [Planctomycetota bacterium]REK31309.1 MAG: hypothetical protein DWQ41_00205 [Planctomycetota bacterium]REK39034.1 MAG: hypothetical protein DWQ45_02245 [Planctomycetota bacterium]
MPNQSLNRDEYIEQAYFFRVCRERVEENTPAQEALAGLREEVLATTRLPMVIDFLLGELNLHGRMGDGMASLSHYFTPFQAFVVQRAEDEDSRFDMRIALQILEHEAEYRAGEAPTPQALFVYQFECIARNRLGYDAGMSAIAADSFFDDDWRDWILKIRRELGTVDFADLIYLRSEHRVNEVRFRTGNEGYRPSFPVLFGVQEGRIAKANRGKDPLYMFAALQRHLGYPRVPRPKPRRTRPLFDPHVELRFQRLEAKLSMLEADVKGDFDLSEFYVKNGGEREGEQESG